MFSPGLGHFHRPICLFNDLVANAMDLIAEDETILLSGVRKKLLKGNTFGGLFHRDNSIALNFQFPDGFGRMQNMFPGHRFGGTEGSLLYFAMRWNTSDPGQVNPFYPEGVGRAKGRANVV